MRGRWVLLAAVAVGAAAGAVLVLLLGGRRMEVRTQVETVTAPASASASGSRPADVRVARTRLGPILVDRRGHTLYLFTRDRHGRSACSGACARVWPPALASGRPRGGPGVAASRLTTLTRPDRRRQLVYNGHPLYAMSADTREGETEGQGFLGTWFVVSPAGDRVGARSGGGYEG